MDTQAIYLAAVRKRDEQEAMARALGARNNRVQAALKFLSITLQMQAIEREIMVKRMMFGVGTAFSIPLGKV